MQEVVYFAQAIEPQVELDAFQAILEAGALGLAIILAVTLLGGIVVLWKVAPNLVDEIVGVGRNMADSNRRLAVLSERLTSEQTMIREAIENFEAGEEAQLSALEVLKTATATILEQIVVSLDRLDQINRGVEDLSAVAKEQSQQDEIVIEQLQALVGQFSQVHASLQGVFEALTSLDANGLGKNHKQN